MVKTVTPKGGLLMHEQFLNVIKSILIESDKDISNISFDEGKTYLNIWCHEYTICRLKITGKLNYWLINTPIDKFRKVYATDLEFTQASSSEGLSKTRLFIKSPADIFNFKSIVISRYDECCEAHYYYEKYQQEKIENKSKLTDNTTKRNKGKSLLEFPESYVVIDVETTGFSPKYSELIEFAGIKIVDNQEVDRFQSFIKPKKKISKDITRLTGITNEMLEPSPSPQEIAPIIYDFIGDSLIVAHNAHFDINFLYEYFKTYLDINFTNNFICTMKISRKVYPEFENHKLETICKKLNITSPIHRSTEDAKATWEVLNHCKKFIENTIGINDFIYQANATEYKNSTKSYYSKVKASEIAATVDSFNFNHPLYNKHCVFTGELSNMSRPEAMQMVVNIGGQCGNSVTRNTNYLIMGIQDYSKFIDGEKSSKTKKAEELINRGQELEIISEDEFYELLAQEY